jgi:hypothetical protein
MTAAPRQADSIMLLDIDRIRIDGGTQPRDHINVEVAERYKALIEDGREFPPVTVFFDGTDYWLADGFHRITAWGSLNYTNVAAEVRSGTLRDAQWHSFSVNAKHGYPRGSMDVDLILGRIFGDPQWSRKPLNEIARHTQIPYVTVQRRYVKHLASYPVDKMKPPVREVTRGGVTYEMDTSGIGSRPNGTAIHDGAGWHEVADPDAERNPENRLKQSEQWRQTDIEEFTGRADEPEPAPRYPPEHTAPAEHIRWLVEQLYEASLKLSPGDVAYTVSIKVDRYIFQLANLEAWVSELCDCLKILQENPDE